MRGISYHVEEEEAGWRGPSCQGIGSGPTIAGTFTRSFFGKSSGALGIPNGCDIAWHSSAQARKGPLFFMTTITLRGTTDMSERVRSRIPSQRCKQLVVDFMTEASARAGET